MSLSLNCQYSVPTSTTSVCISYLYMKRDFYLYFFLFHTVIRTLKLGISVVTGILLMSNGTLVSYGHGGELQHAGAHSYSIYRFCQHNLETEQLIYSKKTKTTGAIEIISDRKPTLLLSDG